MLCIYKSPLKWGTQILQNKPIFFNRIVNFSLIKQEPNLLKEWMKFNLLELINLIETKYVIKQIHERDQEEILDRKIKDIKQTNI